MHICLHGADMKKPLSTLCAWGQYGWCLRHLRLPAEVHNFLPLITETE